MQKKQHTKKVIFLTGGGTGGHIYPCVSILNELLALNGADNSFMAQVFYAGNKKNPEFEIVSKVSPDVKFLDVPVFGMPRKIGFKFIKWVALLIISVVKCLCYSLKYRPDTVFATGGYVSAPMVIVSNILKIPYVMHDSDARPGIVTRAFAGGARAVNLAFSEGNKFVKSKNITNFKNPVRNEFFTISKEEAREELNIGKDDFCVLIMGGSQGAKTINNAAVGLIKHFSGGKNINIIFQTGKKNYDDVIRHLKGDCDGFIVRPYFEKMYLPILAADIVVSRAGSLSISEILAAKKPSLLVPYPYAAADHQRKNAREIEKTGAAIYVEDADLNAEILIEIINDLWQNPDALAAFAKNASGQIDENPTGKILNLVLDAANANIKKDF